MVVGNIVIVDFPHIRCLNCGTQWVASDLVFPIEKYLVKHKIDCEAMTIEEIYKLIDDV